MNKSPETQTLSDAFTTWGSPAPDTSEAWWRPYVTVQVLLAHVSLMFVTTAALTLVNLIVSPETWWSLVIIVFWLTLVALHALGATAVRFLIDADEQDTASDWQKAARRSEWADTAQNQATDADAGDFNSRSSRGQTSPGATESWDMTNQAEQSWPEPNGQMKRSTLEQDDRVEETGWAQAPTTTDDSKKVPWRAATDIAWLRHRENGSSPSDSKTRESRP